MAAVSEFALNLSGGGEPQRLRALAASPGFLEALGVTPVAGRTFRAAEDEPGQSHVAILTNNLWRTSFGADPAIVGRKILLNAEPYDVVGVLPSDFWWTSTPEILVPLSLGATERAMRTIHAFRVVARRRPDVSLEQARADMAAVGRDLAEKYPAANREHAPRVAPIRESLVGDMRQSLLVLLGAVVLVLLIACANVSTLLTARGTARRKEIAIRLAMGAGRGRLVRQLLTESLFLALLGGVAGVLVAQWTLDAMGHVWPPRFQTLPGLDRVTVDVRVLAVALIATVTTSLLFGLLPAFTISRDAVGAALTEEGRSGTSGVHTRRIRAVLVVAEVALSLVLLIAAGLLLVSFRRLIDVSPGFQVRHVTTMRVTLPQATYRGAAQVTQFFDALIARVREIPGVESAGSVTLLPFSSGESRSGFQIENRADSSPIPVRAYTRLVSPEYLATLRVPLIRGRFFTSRDAADAPGVVIINETTARRFWPDENPIGHRLSFDFDPPRWLQIAGVAGDIKHARLDADANPEAYTPYAQVAAWDNARGMTIVVRSSAGAAAIAPALRAAVRAMDAQQPVGAIREMDALIEDSVAPQRLNLVLLVAFAAIALVLTAQGLYGVMAYLVAQRTREIGVRIALGASRRDVLVMMLREAGAMTLGGIGLGVLGALALTRSLATLLFGVSPADPFVYVTVCALVAAVALIAVAIPSSRATRVDPLTALRS
jgi:putative ABC transport system permease protein